MAGSTYDHDRAAAELVRFRGQARAALARWGDALFELTDAMLSAETPVHCVPGLSLQAVFRRGHGSLYKALARGRVDADALRRLLVAHRPADWPAVYAVDASTWARCDAETSPERGYYYSASHHSAGQPIVAGWSYSWVAQLNWAGDSWTAPLDVMRLPVAEHPTDATVTQIRRLLDGLPAEEHPLFVFDAGYDPAGLTDALADTRAAVLVRIRDDRIFYTDPPERADGATGRPRRHGARFACADPASWGTPTAELTAHDPRHGSVRVAAWAGLHPKLAGRGRWADREAPPIVTGTVIRVDVEHLPKRTARAKKTLWLWWAGPGEADLSVCWRAYLRRFDLEHTYRFVKGPLGWTTPAVRTPEQADRWTWLTVLGYTQLRLARPIVNDQRLPWERRLAAGKLTPTRVRRAFPRLAPAIGTPASPPKSRTPGPGRPKGTKRPPRTRHPAVKKTARSS